MCDEQKRFHLFIFVFIFIALAGGSKKILLKFISEYSVYLCFPLKLYSRFSQVPLVVKNSSANAGDIRDMGSISGL